MYPRYGISIDPGHSFGVALWEGRFLRNAIWLYAKKPGLAWLQTQAWISGMKVARIHWVAIEKQIVRTRYASRGILNLAEWSGAFLSHAENILIPGGEIRQPLPENWKGQMSKNATIKHVIACLTMEEHKLLPREMFLNYRYPDKPAKRVTDLADAIGIGLWYVGRF